MDKKHYIEKAAQAYEMAKQAQERLNALQDPIGSLSESSGAVTIPFKIHSYKEIDGLENIVRIAEKLGDAYHQLAEAI